MRSFGERTEFLRHGACRVWPTLRWYIPCLALLIFPSVGLAQLNHIEVAARLLSQGQLAKVEASLHNYRQSLDVAGPIVAQLNGSEDGILLLATDYGSLGEKEELSSLVRTWQQLPAPSDESSLEFGNVLTMFGMTLEAKQ